MNNNRPIKTREDLIKFHGQLCDRARTLMDKKNHDYGANDDPFQNFTRSKALGICTTEQGILVRMTDKFCRIASYLRRGTLSVEDETVLDTLIDMINYTIFLAGVLHNEATQVAITHSEGPADQDQKPRLSKVRTSEGD